MLVSPPDVVEQVLNSLSPGFGNVLAQCDTQFCDQFDEGNFLSCMKLDHL